MNPCRNIIFVIFCAVLTACSATGPRYNELSKIDLAGKSEVIIYRESKLAAAGSSYCIKINGNPIGILSNGGFLRTFVDPGTNQVSIPSIIRRSPPTELTIESKENEKVYLLHSIDLASMFVLPIGPITAINTSWDKKLAQTPEEYSINILSKLREAKVTDACKT